MVDGEVVEQAYMGAYEIRLAMWLAVQLETFASEHQLGRAIQDVMAKVAEYFAAGVEQV